MLGGAAARGWFFDLRGAGLGPSRGDFGLPVLPTAWASLLECSRLAVPDNECSPAVLGKVLFNPASVSAASLHNCS